MRDKLLTLANQNFNLNAFQVILAVDYVLEKFDVECSESDLIYLIDEALFQLFVVQAIKTKSYA
jgi:hypothetical protein